MKVKNFIAQRLGVSEESLVIHRIGGWLQDSLNDWNLFPEGHASRPSSPKLFNPNLPTEPLSYYAEVSIMNSDVMGQKFTFEFRPSDLNG